MFLKKDIKEGLLRSLQVLGSDQEAVALAGGKQIFGEVYCLHWVLS